MKSFLPCSRSGERGHRIAYRTAPHAQSNDRHPRGTLLPQIANSANDVLVEPAPALTGLRLAIPSKIYGESGMALRRQARGQMVPTLFVEDYPVSQEHCVRALAVEVAEDDAAVTGLIRNLADTAAGVTAGHALLSLSPQPWNTRDALPDQSSEHKRQAGDEH
jgi:hypothetical protein